jgi:hypothetical protein
MQKNREVEDGEALYERQWHPDQRVLKTDESPRRKSKNCKLPGRNYPVSPRRLAVKFAQRVPRQGVAELGPESYRVLRKMM